MELTLNSVNKSYDKGATRAVDDLSYTFTPGVYGLLGPNGAGKSTLMNMITDNLSPSSGSICYNGEEIGKLGAGYRALLGYMPQQQSLYDNFTGERFLWYMAALKGLTCQEAASAIESVIETVNLSADRHKRLKVYSGGMKQRILIAQALLNDPKILIMDEPTAGLDPRERIRIRSFISEISKNKIVLLATHVVPDVEYISKEILIMNSGRIIMHGTPRELLSFMESKVYEVLTEDEEYKEYERSNVKIANVTLTDDKICLRVVSDTRPNIGDIRKVHPTLEDVYLYLVE